MRLWMLGGIVVGVLALGAAACGGDDDNGNGAEAPPPPAPEEQPAEREKPEPEAAEKIAVKAEPGGGLEFEQDSLEAPAGEIAFDFANDSSIPHNLSIEKDGELVDQTDTITSSKADLKVDLEPGEYTFYCSVPGHRPGGMEGKLTVK